MAGAHWAYITKTSSIHWHSYIPRVPHLGLASRSPANPPHLFVWNSIDNLESRSSSFDTAEQTDCQLDFISRCCYHNAPHVSKDSHHAHPWQTIMCSPRPPLCQVETWDDFSIQDAEQERTPPATLPTGCLLPDAAQSNELTQPPPSPLFITSDHAKEHFHQQDYLEVASNHLTRPQHSALRAPPRRKLKSTSGVWRGQYFPHDGAHVYQAIPSPTAQVETRRSHGPSVQVNMRRRVPLSPAKLLQAIPSGALRRVGFSSNERKGLIADRLATHGINNAE